MLSERNTDTLSDQNESRISDDNIRMTRTNSSPYLIEPYQKDETITTQIIEVEARRRSSLDSCMLLYLENDELLSQGNMYLRERNSTTTNGKISYV